MGDKLYIIVRSDMTPGLQIAQGCHAIRQFTHDHPEIDDVWFKNSNYIAVLSARDETHIVDLMKRAAALNVRFSVFREPDLDNSITAVVLPPCSESKRICSQLPLALKSL